MKRTHSEPRFIVYTLIGLALIFVFLVLILPLVIIFYEALRQGWQMYLSALIDKEALASIRLTLTTAAIVLPINIFFGLAIAWLITRFEFKGKTIMTTILDIPFAISPIVAGLMLVLLFGSNSLFGGWLESYGLQIIYATPGIILATLFVTFPFIARELIPVMQAQDTSEEEVALTFGAHPWYIFWRITLPNIKWALLYGMILSNARAMGEFGAVSVVSGHIRGETNTMPLHVEILYNEYNFTAAFVISSLLALIALLTIVLQNLLSWRQQKLLCDAQQRSITPN